jgi:hypothetical protein
MADWPLAEAPRIDYKPDLADPFAGTTVTAGSTTLLKTTEQMLGISTYLGHDD